LEEFGLLTIGMQIKIKTDELHNTKEESLINTYVQFDSKNKKSSFRTRMIRFLTRDHWE
jgi:hypothetical protein